MLIQAINKILLIIANTGHIAHFHSVFRSVRAFMQPITAKLHTVFLKITGYLVRNGEQAYFAIRA